MSNKLRYFVKLDREGTPVAGSNLARTKTPKVGVWQEILKDTCCGPEVAITIGDLELGSGLVLTFTCSGGGTATFDFFENLGTLTILELSNHLNETFPYLGQFFVTGEAEITVKLESNFYASFCPDGDVTATLVES